MGNVDYKFRKNFIYFVLFVIIFIVLMFVEYSSEPEGKIYSIIKLAALGILGLLLLTSFFEKFTVWPILYMMIYILVVYVYNKFGLDSDDWRFLLTRVSTDSFLCLLVLNFIFKER